MKLTSRKLLAAALLAAIPMSSAFACTTANWTSLENGEGLVTGTPTAGDPNDATSVARYSGECGLLVDAGDFVTNNAPDGESVYRARFYVYTSSTGTSTVFRATSADDNAGAEVLKVEYTAPGTFSFYQNGVDMGDVTGAAANKWFAIEVAYESGVSFSATVDGNNGAFSGSIAEAAAAAGTIESHSLGLIAGAGTARVDAFESTRSADTAIGLLCRGDANGDGTINVVDASAVISERVGNSLAAGQPDTNEDGVINVVDASGIITLRVAGAVCP